MMLFDRDKISTWIATLMRVEFLLGREYQSMLIANVPLPFLFISQFAMTAMLKKLSD